MKVQVNPRNQCLNNIVLQLLGKTKSFLHKYFIYCRTRIYTMIINTIHGQFDITQSLFEEIMRNNPEWILLEADKSTQEANDHIMFNYLKAHPDDYENAYQYTTKMHKQDDKEISDQGYRKIAKFYAKMKNHDEELKNPNGKKDGFRQFVLNTEGPNALAKASMPQIVQMIQKFNRNQELHKQIQEAETLAIGVIKRVKDVIQTYAGLAGSHISGSKSQFNTYDKTKEGNTVNNNTTTPSKSGTPTKEVMVAHVEQNDDKILNEEDTQNTTTTSEPVMNPTGTYKTTSGTPRKVKTALQQAFGGFAIEPLFKNVNQAGKALKYYKASCHKNNGKSLIDDMIDLMFYIKFDNEEQIDKKYQKELKKFESMVYSFLHNVVYKLEINNIQHYDNVMQIIRGDPTLNDMFNVNYNYTRQQFDTKENVIMFRNKQDSIVDFLLVARPLLYQGRKLAKGVIDAFSHLNKTEY